METNHRVSGRQYDLLLISLTTAGRSDFHSLIDPCTGLIPSTRSNILRLMTDRCSSQQNKVYGPCQYSVDKNLLWRNTGGKPAPFQCWLRYKDSPDVYEHHLPTFAACFGRVDILGLFEVPSQYWSQKVRALLTADSRVHSVVSIPMYRYKQVHLRDGDIFKRELHRYRFRKLFVLLTFVRFENQDGVLPFCEWLTKDSGFFHWTDLPAVWHRSEWTNGGVGLDYNIYSQCEHLPHDDVKECARELIWSEMEKVDPRRLEIFLTLTGTHNLLIKSEFDTVDEIPDFVRTLRSPIKGKSFLIAGTESMLSLNTCAPVWSNTTGPSQLDPTSGDAVRSVAESFPFNFRLLLKEHRLGEGIDARQAAIDAVIKFKLNAAQPVPGAIPQYYDYCVELQDVRTPQDIRNVFEAILEINSEGVDVVTIPIFPGVQLQSSPTEKRTYKLLKKGASSRRTSRVPSYDYPDALPGRGAWPKRSETWMRELYDLKVHSEWLSEYLEETHEAVSALATRPGRNRDAYSAGGFAGTLESIAKFIERAEERIAYAAEAVEDLRKLGEGCTGVYIDVMPLQTDGRSPGFEPGGESSTLSSGAAPPGDAHSASHHATFCGRRRFGDVVSAANTSDSKSETASSSLAVPANTGSRSNGWTPGCRPGDSGFNSRRSHRMESANTHFRWRNSRFGEIVQVVEQRIEDPRMSVQLRLFPSATAWA